MDLETLIWRVQIDPFLHILDSSTARTLLQTSAKDALGPYNSLVELSKKVKGTVQGNNTKLELFLSASADSLLQEFKASLSKYVHVSISAPTIFNLITHHV